MYKKPKYSQKYKREWATEFPFLTQVKGDASRLFCSVCRSSFDISYQGKSAITNHIGTPQHTIGAKSIAGVSNIANYFVDLDRGPRSEQSIVAAKELAMAYHTARYSVSLRTAECNSKLIREMFETKFTSGRTKTSAIVQKVISPHIESQMKEAIDKMTFVTLITDTSNRKHLKMLPILVRGFDEKLGVLHFKLCVKTIPNERSFTLHTELIETGKIKYYALTLKTKC